MSCQTFRTNTIKLDELRPLPSATGTSEEVGTKYIIYGMEAQCDYIYSQYRHGDFDYKEYLKRVNVIIDKLKDLNADTTAIIKKSEKELKKEKRDK